MIDMTDETQGAVFVAHNDDSTTSTTTEGGYINGEGATTNVTMAPEEDGGAIEASDNGPITDINDPRLNEVYTGEAEADLNVYPMPPDGVHLLTITPPTQGDHRTAYAKPYKNGVMVIVPIEAIIHWQEQGGDGSIREFQHTIRDWVNDLISDRTPTSSLGNLLRVTGYPHSARITKKELMSFADSVVAGHQNCNGRVQRQGRCQNCYDSYKQEHQGEDDEKALNKAADKFAIKPYLNGERAGGWPQDSNGRYRNSVECHECGSEIIARVQVKAYLPIKG